VAISGLKSAVPVSGPAVRTPIDRPFKDHAWI